MRAYASSPACAVCGHLVSEPAARYCAGCGAPLTAAPAPARPHLAAVPNVAPESPAVLAHPLEDVGRPTISPRVPAREGAQTTRTRRSPRVTGGLDGAVPASDRARVRPLRAGAHTGQPRPAVRRPITAPSPPVAPASALDPPVAPEPDLDLALVRARRNAPHSGGPVDGPSERVTPAVDALDWVPAPLEASPGDEDLFDLEVLARGRRRRAVLGVVASVALAAVMTLAIAL